MSNQFAYDLEPVLAMLWPKGYAEEINREKERVSRMSPVERAGHERGLRNKKLKWRRMERLHKAKLQRIERTILSVITADEWELIKDEIAVY